MTRNSPSNPSPSEWGRQLDGERSWLRRQARELLGRPGPSGLDSEDLVQEAQARGLANRSRLFFENRGRLRSWLKLVVQNVLRDWFRKQRPENLENEHLQRLDASGTSPSHAASSAEFDANLRRAVDSLPAPAGEVVKLRIWEERGFAEIATLLDLSEGNARTLFHRALKLLARHVKDEKPDSM